MTSAQAGTWQGGSSISLVKQLLGDPEVYLCEKDKEPHVLVQDLGAPTHFLSVSICIVGHLGAVGNVSDRLGWCGRATHPDLTLPLS